MIIMPSESNEFDILNAWDTANLYLFIFFFIGGGGLINNFVLLFAKGIGNQGLFLVTLLGKLNKYEFSGEGLKVSSTTYVLICTPYALKVHANDFGQIFFVYFFII